MWFLSFFPFHYNEVKNERKREWKGNERKRNTKPFISSGCRLFMSPLFLVLFFFLFGWIVMVRKLSTNSTKWNEEKAQETKRNEERREKNQKERGVRFLPSFFWPFSFLVLFSFSSFHALSFVNEEKEHNTSHSLEIKWCFVLCSSCFFAYLQMKCVK